jgi:hypothetical protein
VKPHFTVTPKKNQREGMKRKEFKIYKQREKDSITLTKEEFN